MGGLVNREQGTVVATNRQRDANGGTYKDCSSRILGPAIVHCYKPCAATNPSRHHPTHVAALHTGHIPLTDAPKPLAPAPVLPIQVSGLIVGRMFYDRPDVHDRLRCMITRRHDRPMRTTARACTPPNERSVTRAMASSNNGLPKSSRRRSRMFSSTGWMRIGAASRSMKAFRISTRSSAPNMVTGFCMS